MQVIVDRIEGEFVIVEYETGKTASIPKELFNDVKEGDVINIGIDLEETQKRKDNIKALMDDLFID